MNIDAAREFVASQGNAVERASLHFLVSGKSPSPSAIGDVLEGQRVDGAWEPFWAPDYGSLDATCYRLAQAHSIGVGTSHAQVRSALEFILQRQQEDGHWEEDTKVAGSAPPWVAPGELSASLYLTANCGWWISLAQVGAEPSERAGAYLGTHLDDEGKLPSFLNAHWLAAGLWRMLGWRDEAERIMTYLLTRLGDLDAADLVWLVSALVEAGVPSDQQLVKKASQRLMTLQGTDGRWSGGETDAGDTRVTLDAMRALHLAGFIE